MQLFTAPNDLCSDRTTTLSRSTFVPPLLGSAKFLSGLTTDQANLENMSATKPVSDTFCSIDDLLIERANNDPGEPIIGYPRSETASSDFLFLNAREIHECTDAAARKLLDQGLRQVVGLKILK